MEEQFERRRFSRDEIGELIETATRLDQMRGEGEDLDFDWFPDRSLDWVRWPAAGWGIGVAIHTFHVLFGVEEEG